MRQAQEGLMGTKTLQLTVVDMVKCNEGKNILQRRR